MGLTSRDDNAGQGKATFLGVAGGYIWDKSAGKDHPSYKTQEYAKLEGEVGVRAGARYDSLNGNVVGVEFADHEQYGESVRVSVDSDGEIFIVSVGTNNRYSQDILKVLLKMDFSKPILMKPYDFTDKVKNKRVQGISFKQGGEKIALRNDDAPFESAEFFKTATQKKKKRFFEDLTEWFVDAAKTVVAETTFPSRSVKEETVEAPVAKAVPKPTVKAVKVEEAVVEELPEVENDDLGSQLDALMVSEN